MKLIKFQGDYADEFDVYGFTVMSDEDWDKCIKSIYAIKYPQVMGFGTNEEMIYERAEDILNDITVMDMPEEVEDEVIKKFFGNSRGTINYGWTPLDSIRGNLSKEDRERIWGNGLPM